MATRSPLVQAAGQMQQLQSADVADIGYPLHGFKNQIINGAMDIWNRGTSFTTTTDIYTADRWLISADGTVGARTVSRQALTRGDTTFSPATPRYFLRVDKTGAGSGQTFQRLQQRIEGGETLSNGNVAVSLWVKADSNRTLSVDVVQNFGTGGSPSADVVQAAQNISVTTAWQKFTLTFALPAVNAKTFGSTDNSYLSVRLILPINTTYTVDVTAVQVEAGSFPTAFEQRFLPTEQHLCKRYFRIVSTDFWAIANGTFVVGIVRFNPVMRATPSSVLSTTAPVFTAQGNTNRTGSGSAATLATAFNAVGGMVWVSAVASIVAGAMHFMTTGTISFDAEL